jgi:hypothetical protein
VFNAGASHYGVADAELLAQHTHKFESRCEAAQCVKDGRLAAASAESTSAARGAAMDMRNRDKQAFHENATLPALLYQRGLFWTL